MAALKIVAAAVAAALVVAPGAQAQEACPESYTAAWIYNPTQYFENVTGGACAAKCDAVSGATCHGYVTKSKSCHLYTSYMDQFFNESVPNSVRGCVSSLMTILWDSAHAYAQAFAQQNARAYTVRQEYSDASCQDLVGYQQIGHSKMFDCDELESSKREDMSCATYAPLRRKKRSHYDGLKAVACTLFSTVSTMTDFEECQIGNYTYVGDHDSLSIVSSAQVTCYGTNNSWVPNASSIVPMVPDEAPMVPDEPVPMVPDEAPMVPDEAPMVPDEAPMVPDEPVQPDTPDTETASSCNVNPAFFNVNVEKSFHQAFKRWKESANALPGVLYVNNNYIGRSDAAPNKLPQTLEEWQLTCETHEGYCGQTFANDGEEGFSSYFPCTDEVLFDHESTTCIKYDILYGDEPHYTCDGLNIEYLSNDESLRLKGPSNTSGTKQSFNCPSSGVGDFPGLTPNCSELEAFLENDTETPMDTMSTNDLQQADSDSGKKKGLSTVATLAIIIAPFFAVLAGVVVAVVIKRRRQSGGAKEFKIEDSAQSLL